VRAATADTSLVSYAGKELTSFKETLQKNDKDSFKPGYSKSLCEKFFNYVFYKKTIPLTLPLIDAKYRQTFSGY
jgi:hypothetical protein